MAEIPDIGAAKTPNIETTELQLYLEQFREASDYIRSRLESVYLLHNFSVLLAGGTGAAISALAAISSLRGAPIQSVRPILGLLLVVPFILVPSALMILRNHFYIDIAELFICRIAKTMVQSGTGTNANTKVLEPRVFYTRHGVLENPSKWARLFMGLIALAEYAIPFSMSVVFIVGFWLLALVYTSVGIDYMVFWSLTVRAPDIQTHESILLAIDGLLLLFLIAAVLLGRLKRPHEPRDLIQSLHG